MGKEFKTSLEKETDRNNLVAVLQKQAGPVNGDAFYWHNNFILGIATRKDFFLKGARFIKPDFLHFKLYQNAYAIYLGAYNRKKLYLGHRDFIQYVTDSDIPDKHHIVTVIEVALYHLDNKELTPEEFDNSMEFLITERKRKAFDQRLITAARKKQNGNLKEAEVELETYLAEFRHLDERSEPQTISAEAHLLDDEQATRLYNYTTGMDRVDRLTGGGWRGETWIIGGYTSDGKTALSKEIVWPNVKNNEIVFWCSLEMDTREMVAIFATRLAQDMGYENLTLNKVRRKEFSDDIERGQYKEVITKLKEYKNLWLYHPEGTFTIRDLEMEIDKLKAKCGLDIVVVDYLELLDPARKFSQYRLEIKETMRVAKRMASEKDIWMIIPHQISRHGRADAKLRKPYPHYIMSDLQESSGVEQNCVVMAWIYQDANYRRESRARIGVSKNRMGARNELGWEVEADWVHCRLTDDGMTKVNVVEVEGNGKKYWTEEDEEDEDINNLPI